MSPASHAPMFVREMGLPLRFALYVLLCLFLLALDARYAALSGLRAGLNAVLHPMQIALAQPWHWLRDVADFFVTHGELRAENAALRQQEERLRAELRDRQAIADENAQLRALLGLPPRPGVIQVVGEIQAALPDPFSRKVVINRGEVHGIAAGWPVVDAAGLVGQVTRVFPWTAEVTLLTDRSQAAPVQNQRNGLRLIVSGQGSDNLLEVRFLDVHADLQPGDRLYTSGIDGTYPAGIPVAEVVRSEQPRHSPFARALCRPLAGVGQYRHVLVLKPDPAAAQTVPQRPAPQKTPASRHAPR